MKFAFVFAISILCAASNLVAKVRETVEETVPLSADGSLVVTNATGSIEIVAWDKNEVHITAEKWARSSEDLASIHVQIDAAPDRVAITTAFERKGRLIFKRAPEGGVNYTINVPRGATLENINAQEGDVSVAEVRGPVNVIAADGFVRATGLASSVTLENGVGAILAGFARIDPNAQLKLTTDGACELTLPDNASVTINARSTDATVHCDLPVEVSRERSNLLEGTLGSGEAALEVRTVRGAITIR